MRDRKKTLLVVGGVAVVSLAAGVVAGRFVQSPADAAAEAQPPEATAITASVELRVLESTVVTRGDALFAGAVEVTPQVAGLTVPSIVTGRVPEVGDEITEAQPMLEIIGRPVLALRGDLPMYRTLRPGMAGPDVRQLEQTLDRLGFDPGSVDEDYTTSTSAAVRNLYEDAGYTPPEADAEAIATADAARAEVEAREDEVRAAEQALAQASRGPSEAERVAAQQAVDAARRELDNAKETGDDDAIAAAEDQLELAIINRDELMKDPDTSAQQAALDDARARLDEAQHTRDEAQMAADTPLPASEIVFLQSLPRRVDDVVVKRGDEVSGAVMTVSGADMVIEANVDQAVREQLAEQMPVLLDLPTGEQVEGKITGLKQAAGQDASGFTVTISPPELESAQVEALRGANIRLTIPITSTGDEVLAVPLAALTAGPGGESRVEVVSADGTSSLVEVDVGLTAEGYAEVAPTEGALFPGDLVVVGE